MSKEVQNNCRASYKIRRMVEDEVINEHFRKVISSTAYGIIFDLSHGELERWLQMGELISISEKSYLLLLLMALLLALVY